MSIDLRVDPESIHLHIFVISVIVIDIIVFNYIRFLGVSLFSLTLVMSLFSGTIIIIVVEVIAKKIK